MVLSDRDAQRVAGGRKLEHRIARGRVAPARHKSIVIRRPVASETLFLDGERLMETRPLCRVRIIKVEARTIEEMTDADAKREGFRSLRDFMADWVEQHGELKAKDPTLVWAISWTIDQSAIPRFLSSVVVAGSQGDYVTTPSRSMRGEGEAVDEFTQDEFTQQAHERDTRAQRKKGAAVTRLPVDQQLVALRQEAARRYVDIRSEVRQIERYGHRDQVVAEQLTVIRARLGLAA